MSIDNEIDNIHDPMINALMMQAQAFACLWAVEAVSLPATPDLELSLTMASEEREILRKMISVAMLVAEAEGIKKVTKKAEKIAAESKQKAEFSEAGNSHIH